MPARGHRASREGQGAGGGADGQGHGRGEEPGLVAYRGRHAHRRHAEVVHRRDGQTHGNAAEDHVEECDVLPVHDQERQTGAERRRQDRGDAQGEIVGHADAQVQGEHAHKVHRPHGNAHQGGARDKIAAA